jgi:hypothetical protein
MKREHQSWLFIYLTYRPPEAFLNSIRTQVMSIRVGDMGMGGICDITNRNLNRDLDRDLDRDLNLTKADTHTLGLVAQDPYITLTPFSLLCNHATAFVALPPPPSQPNFCAIGTRLSA